MEKILVTGGAGFIGSNLIRNLLLAGDYHVVCLDNFDPYYPRWQKEMNIRPFLKEKRFRLIEGDICSLRDLARVGAVDTIVHLAAKAGVRNSFQQPFLYDKVNVEGTRQLLEFAREQNVRQFVYSSSSSIYGESSIPWKENGRIGPLNPYAMSKFSAETLGELYSHMYGIRFLALRFFTVYGPSQRPDQAIHNFVDLAMQGRPVTVFGDGSSSRDYTYVSDIVAGIRSAMTYKGSDFEIINLGNNNQVSLHELIDLIGSVCRLKVQVEYSGKQRGDATHTCSDIQKAQSLLNYRPTIDLKEGLQSFFNWFMVNLSHIHSSSSLKRA